MKQTLEMAQRRVRIWRHNSFLGHCAMGRVNMNGIATAETTTDESRELAREIETKLGLLALSLRERRNG